MQLPINWTVFSLWIALLLSSGNEAGKNGTIETEQGGFAMTSLKTKAILAPKIRLGRVVLYFYLITFTVIGIITYLAKD